jgi:catechol 2,3-dioxygenase-like lactoylglutathione lyase family enzyme
VNLGVVHARALRAVRRATRRAQVCQNGRVTPTTLMLGQFLEYSVTARPLAASFDFYRALGFASIPVGDALPYPYVVLYDGAVAIGLHDGAEPGARVTFVRPGLRSYVRPLRRLDIELDFERVADNEFNTVGFTDPGGQPVALVEARTFPPGDWDTQNVTACGEFFELTLPAQSLERSRRFWQRLGLADVAGGEEPHPWRRLSGRGLTIGLHEVRCPAGLSFRSTDIAARSEYLRAKGLAIKAGSPLADRSQPSATLRAPEGTVFYLFESGAQ